MRGMLNSEASSIQTTGLANEQQSPRLSLLRYTGNSSGRWTQRLAPGNVNETVCRVQCAAEVYHPLLQHRFPYLSFLNSAQ